MERRKFIKSTCLLCAGVAGAGLAASALSSCASTPIYKALNEQDKLNVPFSSFSDSPILVVRNSQMDYDILLVKKSESDVTAMLMKCTHQDNALTANKNGLFCSVHGSTFDLQGNVTKEPALNPLKKFKTEINNQIITISLKS